MNAIKGAGPAGLSSIPRRRNIIVRPLIDLTHEELCRYLEVAGIAWREDESNQDTSYLRNFVRHRVIPVARERNESLARNVGAACDILGDEDAFMAHLAATALRSCTRRQQEGLVVLDAARVAAAEVAIARRMVRLAVKQLDAEARLEMRHVESILRCVAAGEGSLTLPGNIDARIEFGTLSFRTPTERERAATGWLPVPGSMVVAGGRVLESAFVRVPEGRDAVSLARGLSAEAGGGTVAVIDAAALGYASRDLQRLAEDQRWGASAAQGGTDGVRLWVDGPAAGDVMCPLGMQGRSKKLSDLINEARVPLAERAGVPVVRSSPGGAIAWVAGVRADERFKCTPTSSMLVKLTIRPIGDV